MDGVGSQEGASSSIGSYFTPLLISIGGILATSLALILYHFLLVRYCLRRRPLRLSNSHSLRRRSIPQIPPGLDDQILAAIPILCYSTQKVSGQPFRVDQSECVICLGELEDGDKVRSLPNCRHAFHISCIDEWFCAHTNCPVCRSPMVAVPFSSAAPNLAMQDHDEVREGVRNPTTSSLFGDHEQGGVLPNPVPSNSNGFLRHCVSMVLPVEGRPLCVVTELKRSLSMDHSHVAINIQREPHQKPSSSSSSSASSKAEPRSMPAKKFDRMSSMITRSFSQLRIGRSSSRADTSLP
ncbi:hypothetical protein FNV43_RR15684 [Rhamnella rubrinervis]|uniref:RING-type E3 ubiquitin transferase n=1 Tax=Rhamnella rubrinervis TaxID=2594499 RepID=A0A8K0E9D1_9ROSA|nr:hypothetical protein FNV43_RR15684 [Rhamnella rubrinervis]